MKLDDIIAAYPEHFARFKTVFEAESARMIEALRDDFSECEFELLHTPHVVLIKHPSGKRLPLAVRAFEPIRVPNDNTVEWAREVRPIWLSR